jgi:hypothetical protein
MGREVNQPQHWAKYVEKFCDIFFLNLFTLAAEVAWALRNLSQGWQHMKLRNHYQRSRPCCKQWTDKAIFIASSKAIRLILVNNQLAAQFLLYIFISILYMFRATLCSSSGEPILSIMTFAPLFALYQNYIVWLL